MTAYEPITTRATSAADASHDSGHRFDAGRRWAATLDLAFDARQEQGAQVTRMTRTRFKGPLRVQRPFYPEGKTGCCHVYLLHPPGGLVSGDALNINVSVGSGAHTLVTTPRRRNSTKPTATALPGRSTQS